MYDSSLQSSWGPYYSSSISDEPRNIKQIKNRKQKQKQGTSNNKDNETSNSDELTTILFAQQNIEIVRTVSISKAAYYVFLYSTRQINDISIFCCDDSYPAVLPIDTTFILCNQWLTDTSYRNKPFLNKETGYNLLFLGPIMLHFTKDRKTFGRFALVDQVILT